MQRAQQPPGVLLIVERQGQGEGVLEEVHDRGELAAVCQAIGVQ